MTLSKVLKLMKKIEKCLLLCVTLVYNKYKSSRKRDKNKRNRGDEMNARQQAQKIIETVRSEGSAQVETKFNGDVFIFTENDGQIGRYETDLDGEECFESYSLDQLEYFCLSKC